MEINFKAPKHTPPHLFQPHTHYFITGATYHHHHLLHETAAKEKTIEYMFHSFHHFDWTIEDWVLLDNHYHIMAAAPENPETLATVINNFHKFSALWIKKNLSIPDSKIWYNYWDTCITFESSYCARIHYLWMNPVRHKYVEHPKNWEFGSFVNRTREEIEPIMEFPFDRLKIKDDF